MYFLWKMAVFIMLTHFLFRVLTASKKGRTKNESFRAHVPSYALWQVSSQLCLLLVVYMFRLDVNMQKQYGGPIFLDLRCFICMKAEDRGATMTPRGLPSFIVFHSYSLINSLKAK